MKLKNKINYSYLGTYTIVSIILLVFINFYVISIIKNNISSYLVSTNHARAEHIRTFISEEEKISNVLNSSLTYIDFFKKSTSSKEYSTLKEEITQSMIRIKASDPLIYEVLLMGLDGKTIISTDETQIGNDESKDDYFIEGKSSIFFKDAYFMSGRTVLSYGVSSPIIASDGTLLGVAMLRFKTTDFYSVVQSENGLGKTEENFLINKDKFFITPSKFLGTGVIMKEKVETENSASCFDPSVVEYIKKNGYSGLTKTFGSQVVEAKDYRGIDVYATHTYIPETGWCLITKADASDLLSFRLVMIYIFAIVFIIISIIFIIFSSFISSKVLDSINKLIFGIKKIEDGNYNYKTNITTRDEIGDLSKAFDKMVEMVKSSKESFQSKIDEQTKDLVIKSKQLEDQNFSILNVLEDIEKEKSKVEETVNLRTKELNEETARLEASINSLTFGFIVVSTNGNIVLSNTSLLKIFNIDKAPNTITEFAKFFEKFDLIDSYNQCVKTQETVEIDEVEFFNKYLKLFYSPIVSINKIIDYVIIIEDITEAKLLTRSKDEFFAVASHELRTPLTAIHGNTSMILSSYKDKISNNDVKEMLEDIDIASVRLIGIVNAFLEVSRLEQGKIITKKDEFKLQDIINKVINDLKDMYKKKGLLITYNQSSIDLPSVFADKSQTEQVLVNLISNAIKYTNKGNIVITTVANDGFMTVRITDTGVGIDTRNQSLLFRKFQQAGSDIFVGDYSTSSGLGLYISKMLVYNMGGEIGLEKSELGSGSTFFFTLPTTL